MRVRDAIRRNLSPLPFELCTPTGSPFKVTKFHDAGLEVATRKTRIKVKWDVLDSVPAYMERCGGEVPIGATMSGEETPCTLQDALRTKQMQSSFVAPILQVAGVCEILPKQGREKQRIRLK